MTYTRLVQKVQNVLGDFFKTAQDLAAILDNETAQMKEGKNGWDGPLEPRLRVFNILCAIFVKAGLNPPEMEEGLWRASLPKVWDKKRHEQA
jgi:hypothetical protein